MKESLTGRSVGVADLSECLSLEPARIGAERIGLRRAMHAWKMILSDADSHIGYLVERKSPRSSEIIGFGMAVFVQSAFADAMLKDPQPGLNARIVESIAAGNSVIATYRHLQTANASATLDHVVMYSCEKTQSLDASELGLARHLLARAYVDALIGYRLHRMLYEIINDDEFEKMKGYRGVRIVKRFAAMDTPNASWKGTRALCQATAETFSDDPASLAARPFVERLTPILDLSPSQKRLMLAALTGAENAELATNLCRTEAAIKRTWAGIFEKCLQHSPALLPVTKGSLRGQQKRHKVIAYVREHPEELRPFRAPLSR